MEKIWLERSEKMARKFRVVVNGKEYIVEVEEIGLSGVQQPIIRQSTIPVEKSAEKTVIEHSKPERIEPQPAQPSATVSGVEIKSPMSGLILKVHVSEGQKVTRGQKLIVLEAMKMENDILSDHDGTVTKVLVKEGDNVETGQILLQID
ncbi:MAG: glutaconyl-CoA/methylmalonyl-CoA decarboxylase subunit gamma [Pseudothermotoga sp.]|jgi:biotin carboxyl carrier protein|nr:glutaconyl-CoA/methylmalonyl-CoA decarboxylase subunit gamma [Pseudothermotoga sp.]MDK2885247.1 glutaconyl-CoA/methylmalonyl-CoA decarboxylase subunit gamma [Pseudothermotoga sp.]